MLDMGVYNLLSMQSFHGVWAALHQKAGQNTDLAVNEDNLVCFGAKKWV
jgi:hypothetical protein